jgi:hypothetical protein
MLATPVTGTNFADPFCAVTCASEPQSPRCVKPCGYPLIGYEQSATGTACESFNTNAEPAGVNVVTLQKSMYSKRSPPAVSAGIEFPNISMPKLGTTPESKGPAGAPGLPFASNFIATGGEKQSDMALPKSFASQFGSAHLLCLEIEIDLAVLTDLPAAGHPVVLKIEGYGSLDVS